MNEKERCNNIPKISGKKIFEKVKKQEEIEETFNTYLIAKVGDIMYYIDIRTEPKLTGREITMYADPEKMKVVKVQITEIMYDSRFKNVVLCARDSAGRKIECVQEYFFQDRKVAEDAIKKICKAYGKSNVLDIYDVFEQEIQVEYSYLLDFFIKPYDIILTPNRHFTVEAVEVTIDIYGNEEFGFLPTSENMYIRNKKIIDSSQYAAFTIKKLQ